MKSINLINKFKVFYNIKQKYSTLKAFGCLETKIMALNVSLIDKKSIKARIYVPGVAQVFIGYIVHISFVENVLVTFSDWKTAPTTVIVCSIVIANV